MLASLFFLLKNLSGNKLTFVLYIKLKGQYPGSNREPTDPQTIALPIELYYP